MPVRTFAIIAAAACLLTAPAAAQVDPDPLIAPVVFHWGQVRSAWPTLEGGAVSDGSRAFWERQDALMEAAGFTGELFQVAYGWELSQRNHLEALRQRRASRPRGPLPPRIVPFFAAETFPEYFGRKDVLTDAGFESFYQTLRRFFVMYAEVFPPAPGQKGPLDTELLAKVDGRVFITLWWVPLTSFDLPGGFFGRLNDRLERDFGVRAYWSVHEAWMKGGPDDLNFLFNGSTKAQWGRNLAHPSVDLLVAFWPPNLVDYTRGLFAARDAGSTYAAAWDQVIASRTRPSIVLVESYNEVTEGSHLMPSWPVSHSPGDGHWSGTPDDAHCAAQACHPVEFTDAWGANPWLYLDLGRRKIREWLRGPAPGDADEVPPHAFIAAPRSGEVVSGAAALKVVAADDRSLREVRVYIDGWLSLTEKGSVDRRLKTWILADGPHLLAAEVIDAAGNGSIETCAFFVRNGAGGDREDVLPAASISRR